SPWASIVSASPPAKWRYPGPYFRARELDAISAPPIGAEFGAVFHAGGGPLPYDPGALEIVMGAATIGFGLAMIALGVIAYFASGQESWTALIPAIFGVVLAICGGIALKRPMPGVIAAVVVAALGL